MKKKMILFMNCSGRSSLIPPSACNTTMTVEKLIEYLNQYDKDIPIYISDNGWSYIDITEDIFNKAFVTCLDEEKEYMREIHVLKHK